MLLLAAVAGVAGILYNACKQAGVVWLAHEAGTSLSCMLAALELSSSEVGLRTAGGMNLGNRMSFSGNHTTR